jgi:hypothetical protein
MIKCSSCEKADNKVAKCEFCGICMNCYEGTFYEGFFKHHHSQNAYFKGTATSGLLTLRIACDICLEEQEKSGLRP